MRLVIDDSPATRCVIRDEHGRTIAYVNIGQEILAEEMVRRSNAFSGWEDARPPSMREQNQRIEALRQLLVWAIQFVERETQFLYESFKEIDGSINPQDEIDAGVATAEARQWLNRARAAAA